MKQLTNGKKQKYSITIGDIMSKPIRFDKLDCICLCNVVLLLVLHKGFKTFLSNLFLDVLLITSTVNSSSISILFIS